jgi:hypothetical protein
LAPEAFSYLGVATAFGQLGGIQAGGMMLFPAISAQFMAADRPAEPPLPIQNPDQPGHHHWSHLHTQQPGWHGLDLSAGIEYLIERGYLEQGTQNRIAYILTDAGFAAPWNQG